MLIRLNTSPLRGAPLIWSDQNNFSPDVLPEVRRHLVHVPYDLTPLQALSSLAKSHGLCNVLVKDEGRRSSLGSFKALGGSHAVIRLVLEAAGRHLQRVVEPEDLFQPDVQAVAKTLTFTCATDGNHGRAVASGARIAGSNSRIFVHEGVSAGRVSAIEAEGAIVTRTTGNYDDSLTTVNVEAEANGWLVVSDTSWPGYESIPVRVMQGYLVMVDEAIQQALEAGMTPTHVFLQAGVGGYAAAVAAFLSLRLPNAVPKIIIVEPSRAACIYESAVTGKAVRIPAGEPTVMSMLECYEPSAIAWRILERLSTAFLTIDENSALSAMHTLAKPSGNDTPITAGESGGAGLAGAIASTQSPDARRQLGLDGKSIVLVFNTEGATDQALYQKLMDQAGGS